VLRSKRHGRLAFQKRPLFARSTLRVVLTQRPFPLLEPSELRNSCLQQRQDWRLIPGTQCRLSMELPDTWQISSLLMVAMKQRGLLPITLAVARSIEPSSLEARIGVPIFLPKHNTISRRFLDRKESLTCKIFLYWQHRRIPWRCCLPDHPPLLQEVSLHQPSTQPEPIRHSSIWRSGEPGWHQGLLCWDLSGMDCNICGPMTLIAARNSRLPQRVFSAVPWLSCFQSIWHRSLSSGSGSYLGDNVIE